MPHLNTLFCFQLQQTSLKALGRLMVVLLETEPSCDFFQNIVQVSTWEEYKGESVMPVHSRDRDLVNERTVRGGDISS